jgi:hypothetical protein
MCSTVMQPNPTNMCLNCIRASVDITQVLWIVRDDNAVCAGTSVCVVVGRLVFATGTPLSRLPEMAGAAMGGC